VGSVPPYDPLRSLRLSAEADKPFLVLWSENGERRRRDGSREVGTSLLWGSPALAGHIGTSGQTLRSLGFLEDLDLKRC
jgi:hypothetical protein